MTQLNPSQQAAAEEILHGDSQVVRINAPAGTGKSTLLVEVLGHLAQRPDGSYLATSFTSSAAREVRDRLRRRLRCSPPPQMHVSTFHAFALRRLRELTENEALPREDHGWSHDYRVRQGGDLRDLTHQGRLWRQIVHYAPGGRILGRKEHTPLALKGVPHDAYPSAIRRLRARGVTLEARKECVRACLETGLPQLYDAWCLYDRVKASHGLWDFDDALEAYLLAVLGGAETWTPDAVLVDEAQDNSTVQLQIAQALCGLHAGEPTGRLVLIGHEAQSIFSFQGADPSVFNGVEARDLALTVNYRSVPSIVALGNQADIAATGDRAVEVTGHRPALEGGAGVFVHVALDPVTEANDAAQYCRQLIDRGHAPENIAILFRTHFAAALYEGAFPFVGVPVVHWGGSGFWSRPDVMAFLAYALLSESGPLDHHRAALEEVFNVPNRYIPKSVREEAKTSEATDVLAFLRDVAKGDHHKRVRSRLRSFRADLMGLQRMSWQAACAWIRDRLVEHVAPSEAARKAQTRADDDRAAVPHLLYQIGQRFASGSELFDYALRAADNASTAKKDTTGRVILSTVHSFKGLERPTVLVSLNEGAWPVGSFVRDGRVDWDEERRLLYVALTRAQNTCGVFTSHRTLNGAPAPMPQLVEGIPDLVEHYDRGSEAWDYQEVG